MATPSRLDKIEGALLATAAAASMAAPTRGWRWQDIEERLGLVSDFAASEVRGESEDVGWGPMHGQKAFSRARGSTTGAIERQRLVAQAVIERGGRIDAFDLAETWLQALAPESFGYHLPLEEVMLLDLLRAGMPATEIGRYTPHPGWATVATALLPIGIVNAGDPRQAALDTYDVGQCLDVANLAFNHAIEVAAALQAGVAGAMRPQASTASITDALSAQLSDEALQAWEWGQGLGQGGRDVREWRESLTARFGARQPYDAIEVLAATGALLASCDWDPRRICVAAANMGRDGESAGICANSLAGALRGIEALPSDWRMLLDEARAPDPYAVSKADISEVATGLASALRKELALTQAWVHEIEDMI